MEDNPCVKDSHKRRHVERDLEIQHVYLSLCALSLMNVKSLFLVLQRSSSVCPCFSSGINMKLLVEVVKYSSFVLSKGVNSTKTSNPSTHIILISYSLNMYGINLFWLFCFLVLCYISHSGGQGNVVFIIRGYRTNTCLNDKYKIELN